MAALTGRSIGGGGDGVGDHTGGADAASHHGIGAGVAGGKDGIER